MTPTTPENCEHRAVIIENLEWRGRTLRIEFEADWSGEEDPAFQIAHLEVFVDAPAKAPIPVTETGYRSHFLPPRIIVEAGGPAAFVKAWLDEQAKGRQWKSVEERWRQLDLFD